MLTNLFRKMSAHPFLFHLNFSALKGYTKQYQKLKGMRTLEWKSYLGLVDLEVTIGDKTLEFSVPPPKAVIIFHFQEKGTY